MLSNSFLLLLSFQLGVCEYRIVILKSNTESNQEKKSVILNTDFIQHEPTCSQIFAQEKRLLHVIWCQLLPLWCHNVTSHGKQLLTMYTCYQDGQVLHGRLAQPREVAFDHSFPECRRILVFTTDRLLKLPLKFLNFTPSTGVLSYRCCCQLSDVVPDTAGAFLVDSRYWNIGTVIRYSWWKSLAAQLSKASRVSFLGRLQCKRCS